MVTQLLRPSAMRQVGHRQSTCLPAAQLAGWVTHGLQATILGLMRQASPVYQSSLHARN
jgi:hypothetical protein